MMTEFRALERISAYIAENKQQLALEAEVKSMVVEASGFSQSIGPDNDFDPMSPDKSQMKSKTIGSVLSMAMSLWVSRRIL